MIGKLLGPYQILEKLGEGGMGEVYRARDVRLDRAVAIKVIRSTGGSGDDRRRFLQEAKAASALNHPHIVAVYDIGADEAGADFITMELVEGTPLDRVIAGRPMPVRQVLRLAIQIADAMACAHAAGIVHRDLKPANIVVTADQRAKVLDFGVARLIDAERTASLTGVTTAADSVVGTLSYMAPEQAQAHPVDARADIFAFGAVLYEMLTGRAAFARDSSLASAAAVLHEEPRPIRELAQDVSIDLQRIVERCLRKDRARRFQSMADLHVALQDVADDFTSGRTAAAVVGRPRPRRGAYWIGGALASAAVIAAIVIGAQWQTARLPPTAIPVLTRMTFDNGFTVDPAISPDGMLLAYASDRSGSLDIWVQQMTGGAPIRLTSDPTDEREPSFSPDGSRIVFRAERDGGGLYVVSALGGQAPRLLVAGGRDARYSPDGNSIAYWTGGDIGFGVVTGEYRTFIIPSVGGTPREIEGFTNARFPVWSPDGARVMVAASRSPQPLAETYEWWAVPLDGAQPIATGVADRMKAERIQSVAQFGPSVWGDGRILFSNNQAIYALRVDGDGRSASAVERLTVGTSLYSDPAVGPGGVIAFTSAISEGAIYALPLDVEQGTTTGPAERVTEGAGPFLRSSPSSDGAMVAYLRQTQPAGLLVKNLRTGAVTDLGVLGVTFGPALSPDGSRIAYHDGGGIKVMNAGGGPPRGVCETCSLGDWMPDNRRLVVIGGANIADRFLMIDSDTGSATPVVAGTKGMVLNRPHPTPDGRLLAFREGDSEGARIWLARLDADRAAGPDRWIPMGPPERDARPCGWSPSGRVLYFVSSRDGNRCLYAQRLDPRTSHPAGGPILVKHFHEARNFRIGQAGVLSTGPTNAVRAGKLFYDLFTITADIWTMRPAASHR